MIKSALPDIIIPLEKIFNSILSNKYYPLSWKKGVIVNLFKSGNVKNTDNYRGLTINSCLAKVFNTILNNRLCNYLEENKIISDVQIGFKKLANPMDLKAATNAMQSVNSHH